MKKHHLLYLLLLPLLLVCGCTANEYGYTVKKHQIVFNGILSRL